MIGFDVSTMPLEKNVELTRQAVEAVKSINPRIIIEGELGWQRLGDPRERAREFAPSDED
jgi:fructose/tagatose bisphosphate aldolase